MNISNKVRTYYDKFYRLEKTVSYTPSIKTIPNNTFNEHLKKVIKNKKDHLLTNSYILYLLRDADINSCNHNEYFGRLFNKLDVLQGNEIDILYELRTYLEFVYRIRINDPNTKNAIITSANIFEKEVFKAYIVYRQKLVDNEEIHSTDYIILKEALINTSAISLLNHKDSCNTLFKDCLDKYQSFHTDLVLNGIVKYKTDEEKNLELYFINYIGLTSFLLQRQTNKNKIIIK